MSSINSMPSDILNTILPQVVGNDISIATNLETVCKFWQRHLQSDVVWKPISDHHITNDSEISSGPSNESCREKVKSFFTSNAPDLQKVLDQFGCEGNALHILDKNKDNTELLEKMIQEGQFEPLAYCLLYKPTIDANKIAGLLFSAMKPQDDGIDRKPVIFCYQLLLKAHYDLRSFFKENYSLEQYPHPVFAINMVFYSVFSRVVEGLQLKDFLRSGLDLNAYDEKSSILMSILFKAINCYSEGSYSANALTQPMPTILFSSEKLCKLTSKDRFAESEMKQFIKDVLFESKLNFQQERPFTDDNGNSCKIIAMKVLQELATKPGLPQNNVIKEAFNEYQQSQTKN